MPIQTFIRRTGRALLLLLPLLPSVAAGQQGAAVEAERVAFREWLMSAGNSPLAAVAQRRIDSGVSLGPPEADIPLAGLGPHTLRERDGAATLTGPDGRARPLPRGRLVALTPYALTLAGEPGRTTVTVFQAPKGKPPEWYPYDPALMFEGPLEAAPASETSRVLALDGIEVEATLAGYARLPLGTPRARLRALRLPVPGTEEFELQVYFRPERLSLWGFLKENAAPALAAGGLLLALWLWSIAPRFGPVAPDVPPGRRRLLDHLRASGRYFWASGLRSRLVVAARDAALRRIARAQPDFAFASQAERAARLSSLTGISTDEAARFMVAAGALRGADFIKLTQHAQRVHSALEKGSK